MPCTHDYECTSCGSLKEVVWPEIALFKREVSCRCGGVAVQTWRKAPGLAGVWEPGQRGITPSFRPGSYDMQAGRSFDSISERDRYLKSRGLIAMGPDEYKRTVDTSVSPEISLPGIKDVMNEAWEEAKSSKPAEPLPKVDLKDVTIAGDLIHD